MRSNDLNAGFIPFSQDSTANTAQQKEFAAAEDHRHFLSSIGVWISGAATGAVLTVTIKLGTTVVWKRVMATAAAIGSGFEHEFTRPIKSNVNQALTIDVSTTGAADSVSTMNCKYLTLPSL